jgi:hypothetical protein
MRQALHDSLLITNSSDEKVWGLNAERYVLVLGLNAEC